MSQNRARAARQAAASQASQSHQRQTQRKFWTSWQGGLVAFGVVALLGASFIVPKLTSDKQTNVAQHGSMTGTGDGPAIGSAPRFDQRDVVTGRTISSQTLRGQKTLLFFSEGVMCQACLQQIRDIDQIGNEMARRHIKLVSITPDTPAELRQAIGQYEITSPMIADEQRDVSEAFNTLGKGMHADTPGHAFVLIDGRGKVLWQRDYYQAPYRTMYVEPTKLLDDIPTS